MRLDSKGIPRSQSNEGNMEQKDHILRLARGAKCKELSLDDLIRLIEEYVDSEDDKILDVRTHYAFWAMGGAREP